MKLVDVLAALRRHKLLVFVTTLLFVVIGAAAAYLPRAQYKATSTLVASPLVTGTDVATIQFMLPAILQQVDTPLFKQAVLKRNRLLTGSPDLTFSTSQDLGTGIIYVSATSSDRRVVTPASNAAATLLTKTRLGRLVDLQLLDPAHGAVAASSGRRIAIVLATLVLGLIAAVFAALGAEALRRRGVREQDLSDAFEVDVIGTLPRKKQLPLLIRGVFTDTEYVEFAESLHRVIATLKVSNAFERHRAIAVTSVGVGEGKTTLSCGLAFALALAGDDVVLIDGDLRRPTVHARFGTFRSHGLGDPSSDPVPHRTTLPNLQIVPAMASDEHPTNIVNRWLPDLLKQYEDRIVLIDTPPIASVPEATLITHLASAVILVVESEQTDRPAFERVLHELQRAKVELIGVVLNRAETSPERTLNVGYYGRPVHIPSASYSLVDGSNRSRVAAQKAAPGAGSGN